MNPGFLTQHRLRRDGSHQHQAARAGKLDVPQQKRQTLDDFGIIRRSATRRTPGDQVGEQALAAIKPDARQHLVEQPARRARKGAAFHIFLGPRNIAHDHQARIGVAIGEHQPGGGHAQRAGVVLLQYLPQFFARLRRCGQFGADLPRRARLARKGGDIRCGGCLHPCFGQNRKGRGGHRDKAIQRLVRQRLVGAPFDL